MLNNNKEHRIHNRENSQNNRENINLQKARF
jgi:hypothetical protein